MRSNNNELIDVAIAHFYVNCIRSHPEGHSLTKGVLLRSLDNQLYTKYPRGRSPLSMDRNILLQGRIVDR